MSKLTTEGSGNLPKNIEGEKMKEITISEEDIKNAMEKCAIPLWDIDEFIECIKRSERVWLLNNAKYFAMAKKTLE